MSNPTYLFFLILPGYWWEVMEIVGDIVENIDPVEEEYEQDCVYYGEYEEEEDSS